MLSGSLNMMLSGYHDVSFDLEVYKYSTGQSVFFQEINGYF